MKNSMNSIIITGTPGTGKTTLAKALSKQLGFKVIDVKKIITKHHLSCYYDKLMKCKVVDVKKLNKVLISIIKHEKKECKKSSTKGLIIDSHLSHYLPKKYVDLCIVTKCKLSTLKKRLQKRNYPVKKVRENLDCEIFDVCLIEANEGRHNCLTVDTTKPVNLAKFVKLLKKHLKYKKV